MRLDTARRVGVAVRLRRSRQLLTQASELCQLSELDHISLDLVEMAAHLEKLRQELLADSSASEIAAYGAHARRQARLSAPYGAAGSPGPVG